MITQRVICDECNIVKRESNHWYSLETDYLTLTIGVFIDSSCLLKTKHYCGEACLIKAILKNLPGAEKIKNE